MFSFNCSVFSMNRLKNWWYGHSKENHANECLNRMKNSLEKGEEPNLIDWFHVFGYGNEEPKFIERAKQILMEEKLDEFIGPKYVEFFVKLILKDHKNHRLIAKCLYQGLAKDLPHEDLKELLAGKISTEDLEKLFNPKDICTECSFCDSQIRSSLGETTPCLVCFNCHYCDDSCGIQDLEDHRDNCLKTISESLKKKTKNTSKKKKAQNPNVTKNKVKTKKKAVVDFADYQEDRKEENGIEYILLKSVQQKKATCGCLALRNAHIICDSLNSCDDSRLVSLSDQGNAEEYLANFEGNKNWLPDETIKDKIKDAENITVLNSVFLTVKGNDAYSNLKEGFARENFFHVLIVNTGDVFNSGALNTERTIFEKNNSYKIDDERFKALVRKKQERNHWYVVAIEKRRERKRCFVIDSNSGDQLSDEYKYAMNRFLCENLLYGDSNVEYPRMVEEEGRKEFLSFVQEEKDKKLNTVLTKVQKCMDLGVKVETGTISQVIDLLIKKENYGLIRQNREIVEDLLEIANIRVNSLKKLSEKARQVDDLESMRRASDLGHTARLLQSRWYELADILDEIDSYENELDGGAVECEVEPQEFERSRRRNNSKRDGFICDVDCDFPEEFVKHLFNTCPERVRSLIKCYERETKDAQEAKRRSIKVENYFSEAPQVLVLYGPNGTGKTTIAKMIANKTGRKSFLIKSGNLGNRFQYSVAENLRRELRSVIQKAKEGVPCLVILDELDSLSKRENGHKNKDSGSLAGAIAGLLDILKKYDILIVGTTNFLGEIGSKFINRAGYRALEVPLPSRVIRRVIIARALKNKAKKYKREKRKNLWYKAVNLDLVANKMTDGFCMRNLHTVVTDAVQNARSRIEEQKEQEGLKNFIVEDISVENGDFQKASQQTREDKVNCENAQKEVNDIGQNSGPSTFSKIKDHALSAAVNYAVYRGADYATSKDGRRQIKRTLKKASRIFKK